uniref:CRAL-TRIO domain-containing protein n=1 Tax=Rhodosorus marinus TaxID=101924 RepID=A0A7S3EM45_9RHOD|mmetsp:Transcript_57/g.125  ORF Transcript_57/g.125 Transcript_57/m.125 type:complete len:257 (+) Transcript_57:376-1146(+)|eukprot:CAMPEP_0113961276 /NCGR_PEP_ID=MMETSP0011_2-20120614/5215_1 /TAXON_ID=101924 /ORGANISM="Rhodosorus marinus" /LENGTH=256 /DNA_ID=CAMNT_0000972891 /DNA_START=248 /DNA_END=1018 /DNA_ORIENTATION=- /assembly_acc=CAM_ASM_000156
MVDHGIPMMNVKEKLAEVEDKVVELRRILKDEVQPEHDDILLLKFLLSHHEDPEEAATWYRKAMAYRKENASWLYSEECPEEDLVRSIFKVKDGMYSRDGEPIMLARSGESLKNLRSRGNVFEIMKKFERWSTWMKERIYQECDKLTRTTGLLHKMYFINDMAGMQLWTDLRIAKGIGSSSNVSEMIHPQLIEKQYIVNPPAFIRIVFATVKPFMSKKMAKKVVIVNENNKRTIEEKGTIKDILGFDHASVKFDEK